MTRKVLHLDFETRSRADLFRGGAYRYATDPSTEIICMAYAFDDDPVELWHPALPFPPDVKEFIQAGAPRSLHAHNAQFERLIVENVLPSYW